MKLLLDTYAFLWLIEGNDELGDEAKRAIEGSGNTPFLSVGRLWERAIRVGVGKLEVSLPFTRLAREHAEGNAIEQLSVAPNHLDAQRALLFHHCAPFDRLMISQAKVEGLLVASKGEAFSNRQSAQVGLSKNAPLSSAEARSEDTVARNAS